MGIIEKIQLSKRGGDLEKTILKREAFWISKLGTLRPRALNEELGYSPLDYICSLLTGFL